MLTFYNLNYQLPEKTLFKDLSVTFLPASITCLTGSNGSGKTTLLRVIAGIQKPYSGYVTYYLKNIEDLSLKPYCVYIAHNLGLKQEMSVREHLNFWAKIYHSPATVEAAIHYFQLQNIANRKCYELSKGTQKKVALAKLLACQSDLWLLDEVESNLDSEGKSLLHNLIISKANNGGIILLTSHQGTELKSAQTLNVEDYR